MNWLSYGAGVNSTALAIMLNQENRLFGIGMEPWTPIFADVGDESDETYAWLTDYMIPWFGVAAGRDLVIVKAKETVLERWQRLSITGSRRFRTCTRDSKIVPVERYIREHGGGLQIHGIDAGEAHRATKKDIWYPLVERGIDREGCVEIIREAGLPVPPKSGCWHCPFLRTEQVLNLLQTRPDRFAVIEQLEKKAAEVHGGGPWGYRSQWRDKPAQFFRDLAAKNAALEPEREEEPPCGCYDG